MNKNNVNSIYLLYRYNNIILNMPLRLFLDPITLEKIMKAVKSGKYDDEYAFIFEAIHEKLNQGDSKQSEILLETVDDEVLDTEMTVTGKWLTDQVPDGISVHFLSDNTFKTLKSLMEDNSNQTNVPEFSQDEIYGPGSAGLIWIFHNRFFPVKIVLNIVAQLMIRENKTWLKLDEFSDEIILIIEKFVSEIYGNNSLEPSVHQGFPLPEKALFERYEKMRKERPKAFKTNIRGFRGTVDDKIKQLVTSRLTSSRLRFFSQFIGKSLMKDHGLVYSGACFEMGLLVARGEKKDLEITLSKNGFDFTGLENPAINFVATGELDQDHYESENGNTVNSTFSEEERDFIRNRIFLRYELENNIITNFSKKWISYGGGNHNKPDESELALRGDFIPQLKQIFEKEKKNYLIQNYPDIMATKEKFSISDDDVIDWLAKKIALNEHVPSKMMKKEIVKNMKAFEGHAVSEKDVLGYLVDKHMQFQLTGTLSRMRELYD